MAYKYLQSFLDARLFTIAEDNSTYQFLTATIPAFEKAIIKNNSKIIASTLVALDQDIPQNDPILDEVEELLKKKWQLLRNKYTERPCTLLRAIILEALYNLANQNPDISNIIWLTGSNYFQFVKENGETNILREWLNEIGDSAEKQATKNWELVEAAKTITIPPFTMGKIQLTGVTLDKAALKTGLTGAANNQEMISQGATNYNGGVATIRPEWVNIFATQSAEALFTFFSSGIVSVNKAFNNLQLDQPINDFFATFKEDLSKTLTSTLKSTDKLKLRSAILWWKQALYSESAKISYREMTSQQIAISTAKDLALTIPPIYPVSVDYILKETVLSCIKEDNKKTFSEILNEFADLTGYSLNLNETETGRVSLTGFLQLLLTKKETISNFKVRTGIEPSATISYGGLAVIFLHDIQAGQISTK